jgi:hypothetical protein
MRAGIDIVFTLGAILCFALLMVPQTAPLQQEINTLLTQEPTEESAQQLGQINSQLVGLLAWYVCAVVLARLALTAMQLRGYGLKLKQIIERSLWVVAGGICLIAGMYLLDTFLLSLEYTNSLVFVILGLFLWWTSASVAFVSHKKQLWSVFSLVSLLFSYLLCVVLYSQMWYYILPGLLVWHVGFWIIVEMYLNNAKVVTAHGRR